MAEVDGEPSVSCPAVLCGYGDRNRLVGRCAEIEYRAGGQNFVMRCVSQEFEAAYSKNQWSPSIFMPKNAARTFLRVTDVKLQRLKEITPEEAVAEGAVRRPRYMRYGGEKCLVLHSRYIDDFAKVWDSTVSKADMDTYGWEANPWCVMYAAIQFSEEGITSADLMIHPFETEEAYLKELEEYEDSFICTVYRRK